MSINWVLRVSRAEIHQLSHVVGPHKQWAGGEAALSVRQSTQCDREIVSTVKTQKYMYRQIL